MTRRLDIILLVLAVSSLALGQAPTPKPSQPSAETQTRAALVGTWRLVSFESRTTGGEIRHQLGPAATGQLSYDAVGHMSA